MDNVLAKYAMTHH